MDELRPFQDPDLSSLQVGSACLAKQQDGLWYPARITGEAARGPSWEALLTPHGWCPHVPLLWLGRLLLVLPCSQLQCSYDLAQLCSPPADVDGGYYTIKFDSLLLKEAVVEGDGILPPLRTEPTGSSDSEGSDADDPSYARGVVAQGPRSQEGGASIGSGLAERLPAGGSPAPDHTVGECGCRGVLCSAHGAQQKGHWSCREV